MRKNHQNLFTYLKPAEPPAHLLDGIMKRIEREQGSLKIKIRFVFSLFAAVLMAGIFVPVWNNLQSEAAQSGFTQFISLLFSDLNSVLSSWQDYAMSLLESIPFVSLTVFLGIVFVLLFALRYFVHDLRFVVPPWMRTSMKH